MGMLESLGLNTMVDRVVCGDDEGAMPKPHPRNALAICADLGISPEVRIRTWLKKRKL